jgi:hypothetical protein
MSVNQERIFLSDESERFFITSARETTNFSNVETGDRKLDERFWTPVSNPINELVIEIPGVMPWKSKTGHATLPLGLSIAVRERLSPWTLPLKLILDKDARHRFLALLFGIFGNTSGTKDMLQAVFSKYRTSRFRHMPYDPYMISRYGRNVWSDLLKDDNGVPKVNDLDNAPIPWDETLETRVTQYRYSRANMCIGDIENEDLFTKFTACKMFPELAGEILKNVPRYTKGNLKDVILRIRTNFYYKLLAAKYNLEIPAFTWQEFSSEDYDKYNLGAYTQLIQIAMGEQDCMRNEKSSNMPQKTYWCYSLGRWYRRLRGEMLVLNDANSEHSQLILINRLIRTLGAVMNSGSKLEAETLVDYVDAVIRENNLSTVLSAFSESCCLDSNLDYELVQDVDIPASLLRDTETALDEYVQFITNKDNVIQCLSEFGELQRNISRCTPFKRQSADAFTYRWSGTSMSGPAMISLVTNKFPLISSVFGSQQKMLTSYMRKNSITGDIPRLYSSDARYEMNVNYCREWDKVHEITSRLNQTNPRIYYDSKFIMVVARSLYNDIQKFYRLNSMKSREELLEMAKNYQDNYDGLEDAVRDAIPEYNAGYLDWYTERFA